MTLIQMQSRSVQATPAPRTAADAMDTGRPRVCDDMTVEVALSVLVSDRTRHLLVSDSDGLCTGLLTQAQLTAVRDSSAYTDRLQLRDIIGAHGPTASPLTTVAEAQHTMLSSRLDALPVLDEDGSALGVLALASWNR